MRVVKWAAVALCVLGIVLAVAWATSPDPKFNLATFEDAPLESRIAPLDRAITLTLYAKDDGETATLLVRGLNGSTISGIDLTSFGAARSGNPFLDLASFDNAKLTDIESGKYPLVKLDIARALPSGSRGSQHIGTGTNFPEHAEEAGSVSVFNFPKFGPASPARTTVHLANGILLDYEVELCMRFDRAVASEADFDAAVKGVFLCGDFTNRNALVELADPDNLDSGFGFSDSKSGPDFFPTGPFLVIPKDWATFVADIRMTTELNGDARQDARGQEMTFDFRELALRSLGDMFEARFLYRDDFVFLAPDKQISADMTLMSGTSEGVIFTPPSRGDYIEGVASYLAGGGPLSGVGLVDSVKTSFIESELSSGHFLQPGDLVRYDSSVLGNIEVIVVE